MIEPTPQQLKRARQAGIDHERARTRQALEWAHRLLVCLAKRLYADEGDEDPWSSRVGTTRSIYKHRARDIARIASHEYLAAIRAEDGWPLLDLAEIEEELED